VVSAPHEAFELRAHGDIVHNARILGRLVRGASLARPNLTLVSGGLAIDDLGAGARSRVLRRLQAFARDVVAGLVADIGELATKSAPAPLRGFVHRLEQGLGTALEAEMEDILGVLDTTSRQALEDSGVIFARGVLYVAEGLTASALAARLALTSAWFAAGKGLTPPSGGAVSFAPSRGFDRAAYTAIGYPIVGPRAVRADILARIFADKPEEELAATWLGASKADARKVLAAVSHFRNEDHGHTSEGAVPRTRAAHDEDPRN
jgi:ATP-dependent RNA helicase SUPV3L1/SUV3